MKNGFIPRLPLTVITVSFELLRALIQAFVSVSPVQRLFAYITQEKYEENGWTVYKPVEEFRRQVRTFGCLLFICLFFFP